MTFLKDTNEYKHNKNKLPRDSKVMGNKKNG
jgi:hypothetical protein